MPQIDTWKSSKMRFLHSKISKSSETGAGMCPPLFWPKIYQNVLFICIGSHWKFFCQFQGYFVFSNFCKENYSNIDACHRAMNGNFPYSWQQLVRNQDGGRWIISLDKRNKQILDTHWLETIFFLIGEHADQHAYQVWNFIQFITDLNLQYKRLEI